MINHYIEWQIAISESELNRKAVVKERIYPVNLIFGDVQPWAHANMTDYYYFNLN